MIGEPYCAWCNQIGHAASDDCQKNYYARTGIDKIRSQPDRQDGDGCETLSSILDEHTFAHAKKPDRQDGESAGTILQIGGGGSGMGWGCNTIEVRESTGGNGWRWRTITAVESQWLIDALNDCATPLSSKGAEGAGEVQPFAWTIPGDDQADCNGFIPTKVSREDEFTKPLYTAPPQPAPDAMRNALDTLIEVALRAEDNSDAAPKEDQDNKQAWAAHARKIREAVGAISIALSAAPVSGRDAVIEECAKIAEQGLGIFSPLEIARAIRALSQPARSPKGNADV